MCVCASARISKQQTVICANKHFRLFITWDQNLIPAAIMMQAIPCVHAIGKKRVKGVVSVYGSAGRTPTAYQTRSAACVMASVVGAAFAPVCVLFLSTSFVSWSNLSFRMCGSSNATTSSLLISAAS